MIVPRRGRLVATPRMRNLRSALPCALSVRRRSALKPAAVLEQRSTQYRARIGGPAVQPDPEAGHFVMGSP